MEYLSSADLLLSFQSGFRQNNSTETAILRLLSDIFHEVDCGNLAALVLLDLSAAFDAVDHSILLLRLQLTSVIDGKSSPVVPFVPILPKAIRTPVSKHVISHLSDLWYTAGISH